MHPSCGSVPSGHGPFRGRGRYGNRVVVHGQGNDAIGVEGARGMIGAGHGRRRGAGGLRVDS